MPASAYLDALKMLARRELSEHQVRRKLADKDHQPDEIDEAVARLKAERAIDDARTAGAIVRTETGLKRHGRIRVRQALDRAGIAKATATQAMHDAFDGGDDGRPDQSIDDALIEAALSKRLRHGRAIADEREFARLFRYLAAQGFESDRIMKTLQARRRSGR